MFYIGTIIGYIAVMSVILAAGRGALRLFRLDGGLSGGERIVFSFAVGAVFMSFLVFFLGLAGALYIKWVALVSITAAALFYRDLASVSADIWSGIKALRGFFRDGVHSALFAVMSVSVLLAFIGALAPEKGNDALVYHLADSKYFADHHIVTFIPYTTNSVWPYFMQMLFTLAMLFKNAVLAKLMHFSMAVFAGLGVWCLARRKLFSPGAALISSAVFFLTPGVVTEASYAYIDLATLFYAFAAFYALVLYRETRSGAWLVMTAVFSGVAADTKYIAAVVPVITGAMLFFSGSIDKKGFKRAAADTAVFGLVVLAVVAPYYLRTWLYTGNLFYPFYARFVGETGWYGKEGFDFGLKKTFANFLLSPWLVTNFPARMFAGGESQLGPIYLAFAPLALFVRKNIGRIADVIVFSAVFYTAWFFVFPALRYLVVIVPFLAVIMGHLVSGALEGGGWFRKAALAALFVFLGVNLAISVYYTREEMRFFLKGADTARYIAEQDRSGEIYQFINRELPPDAKILIVNEIRVLYLGRPYLLENYYRLYDKYNMRPEEEIMADVKAKGISHVLFAFNSSQDAKEHGDNRFQDLIKREAFRDKYLEQVRIIEYNADPGQKTRYELYKLK